jgi:hypothetical protein
MFFITALQIALFSRGSIAFLNRLGRDAAKDCPSDLASMTTHSFLSEAVVFLSGLDEISIMDSLQEEVALMPEGTTLTGVSIIGFFGFTLRFFTRRTTGFSIDASCEVGLISEKHNTGVFGDFLLT